MYEEKLDPTTNGQTADVNYVEIIDQMKRETVPIEKYNKLVEEQKNLLTKFRNNESIENSSEKSYSLEELTNQMNRVGITNLEYAEKALEYRQKFIEENGIDPFLPYGIKINPTNDDVEAANRLANILQECIDYAEGDSNLFISELNRRTLGK